MNNPTNIIDDLRLLEPSNPWLMLAVVGGFVLLILGFLLCRRSVARRAQPAATALAAHAHEDALAELAKARSLIQAGNSRAYSIEVSNIVRRYIERRFGIFAPRRSTEEFLGEAAASAKLEPVHRKLLAEFLGTCDFLKFARARAELNELEAQHQAAVRFVTETRVMPNEATPNTKGVE